MTRAILIPLFLTGILAGSSSAATLARKHSTGVHRRRAAVPRVDPTLGDNVDGEDLVIRRAAVSALGSVKGSVVVVDPATGRILTIVNQKLALKSGFTPCSTIKLVTSVAALNEHVIDHKANYPSLQSYAVDFVSNLRK